MLFTEIKQGLYINRDDGKEGETRFTYKNGPDRNNYKYINEYNLIIYFFFIMKLNM